VVASVVAATRMAWERFVVMTGTSSWFGRDVPGRDQCRADRLRPDPTRLWPG
jgi:hypothetical protein